MWYTSHNMCSDEHGVFYSHALGLSPLVTDRQLQRVTPRVWLGVVFVACGEALILER